MVPTHQGRGAEHLMYSTLTKPGQLHVELPGGIIFTIVKIL